jgi:NAD(P)-dependent dehydrogenase (short-subunit alcohol dehydrogenase family)
MQAGCEAAPGGRPHRQHLDQRDRNVSSGLWSLLRYQGGGEALTRSLCKEVGQRGIRVNSVAPGPTDTELLSSANSEDRMKMYASMTPLGRLGQVEDVAGVVAFLAADEAGWVNGQTIRVNGGLVA